MGRKRKLYPDSHVSTASEAVPPPSSADLQKFSDWYDGYTACREEYGIPAEY